MNNEVKYTLSTLKPYKKALRFKGSRCSNLDSSPAPTVSMPPCCIRRALTISWHAHCQALLQPAVLAAVAAGAVDQAVLLTGAGVGCIALLTPPEEALHRKKGHGNTSRYWMNHCGWRINPRLHSLSVDRIHSRLIDLFYSSWWYFCFASARQIR